MPNKTHGKANNGKTGYSSRAYGIWQAMKDRCTNKKRSDWHCYGGKGIAVCPEWAASFETFYADMGEPPPGMTLDRKNHSEGYSKNNCRWATRSEQARNISTVPLVQAGGATKPLWQWFEEGVVKKPTYYWRLHAGWSQEEAILGRKSKTE